MNLVTLRFRIGNAARDAWGKAAGYCCAMPIDPTEDGGYHFWRCGLSRGHKGPHRTVNYLWGHDGGSSYSPVDNPPPRQDRKPVLTRRQRLARERWERAHGIERKLKRR